MPLWPSACDSFLTSVSFNGGGFSTHPKGLYLPLSTQISQSIYQMKPGVQCLKEQSMLAEHESEMARERENILFM